MNETALALGRVIADKYRLDSLLGEGGMGAVFRATQLSVNRPVAVKLIQGPLLKHPEVEKRFRREAESMGRLRHPATVRLYDFGATGGGELYMVMELLEGRDLATQLALHGALSVTESLRIARQVLLALDEAHAQGIVHRDLKPANVFLAELHGGEVAIKVMDFGIAGIEQAAEGAKLTRTGAVLGTPAYMSPEQAQGLAIDGRSDLYALGVMIFEMVTGRVPFTADSAVSLLLAQVTTKPPRLDEVLPDHPELVPVQPLLDALLQKAPAQRPGNATDTIALIDRLLGAVGGGAVATAMDAGGPSRSSRRLAEPAGVRLAQTPPTQTDTLAGLDAGLGGSGSRLRRVGLGAAALAALVMAGWALGGSSHSAPTPAPPALKSESVPLYSVHVASAPSAAKVMLDGVVLGTTPYHFEFRKPQTLTIALAGYTPQTLAVSESSEPHAVVQLAPLPAGELAPAAGPRDRAPTRERPRTNGDTRKPSEGSALSEPPRTRPSDEPFAMEPPATAAPAVPSAQAASPPTPRPTPHTAAPSTRPASVAAKPQSITEAMHNVVDAVSNRVAPSAAYRNVADAKRAYRARTLDERRYEDTIRALKLRRAERIKAEKVNLKEGRITRDEYERRVDRIDAEYKGS